MITANIFVLGFVQGVGFRRFIQKKARALGIRGTVQNLSDGRVKIVACAEKEKIEKLVKIAEQGNIFSDVKDVVVDWLEDEENFDDFLILPNSLK